MRKYSDAEILGLTEEYMLSSEHPDLRGYREQTFSRDFRDKVRYRWTMKYTFKLAGRSPRRILDVGCGCGWYCFTTSLLDSQIEVVGVDILPSMIEAMAECVANMRKRGVTFSLTRVCADICNWDAKSASFDTIYSNEAIEHVHDIDKMLVQTHRLLKPNGKLILLNDANMLNAKVHDQIVSMWEQRENSRDWANYLRSIRPVEHKDARPFAVMRREFALGANPHLNSEEVEAVVRGTAGLLEPEIQRIATNYTHNVPLPTRPQYDWFRKPETGEYAERLFNPFVLAKKMQEAGFQTRVSHLFRKFPPNLVNSPQFEAINRFLFNFRPAFVLVGRKI